MHGLRGMMNFKIKIDRISKCFFLDIKQIRQVTRSAPPGPTDPPAMPAGIVGMPVASTVGLPRVQLPLVGAVKV